MSQNDTRSRLLQAATEVFSEAGYSAASTREISRRGEVNLAAIHYHFGDKAGLYREVFRSNVEQAFNEFSHLDMASVSLIDALACFYRLMLPPVPEDDPAHFQFMRLHAREEADPSGVLDDVMLEAIRPNHEKLMALLRRELGPAFPEIEISRLSFSLAGMASIYMHGVCKVDLLSPQLLGSREARETMITRLTRFAIVLIDSERGRS